MTNPEINVDDLLVPKETAVWLSAEELEFLQTCVKDCDAYDRVLGDRTRLIVFEKITAKLRAAQRSLEKGQLMALAPADAGIHIKLIYTPPPTIVEWPGVGNYGVDRVVVEYQIPATEDTDEYDPDPPHINHALYGWPLQANGHRDNRVKQRKFVGVGPKATEAFAASLGIDARGDAEALLASTVFPSVDAATG